MIYNSLGQKLCVIVSSMAALTAILGLSGCASADATTQQLGIQTDQNRAILAGEQRKTGELLADRRSLQNELARKKSRQEQLIAQPMTPESREELLQVNNDIAKLKKAINSFQN